MSHSISDLRRRRFITARARRESANGMVRPCFTVLIDVTQPERLRQYRVRITMPNDSVVEAFEDPELLMSDAEIKEAIANVDYDEEEAAAEPAGQ